MLFSKRINQINKKLEVTRLILNNLLTIEIELDTKELKEEDCKYFAYYVEE